MAFFNMFKFLAASAAFSLRSLRESIDLKL
jgi:hypothetical protein